MNSDGKHKVLFGTDYPMITADKALEHLDDLGLSDETRRLFLEGNAQRVFTLPEAT
jgi:predicted TIM-barrel fold metal-dependent hydrolase